MMTCREAARLISQELDAPLPRGRRLALWLHVGLCRACRAYRRDLRLLTDWVRSRVQDLEAAGEGSRLSEADRRRLEEALEGGRE
ncbi:anti-sigma factor family protein [Deferrisoma camini]|uniref:anti-sigma factor family protein n=1 Tax=Deferrisoma camini TaxID=1035120 RepID=UPI00046D13C7|nr:hypothetical protein [Deferrisoma camini]